MSQPSTQPQLRAGALVAAPADSPAALLEVRGLTTSLLVDGSLQPVVRGLDLTLRRGEIVGLVGESGSGKSITARSITGLLPRGARVEGQVRFAGVDQLTLSPREVRRQRADQIAMVFQDPRAHINPLWRIEDYIGEGLRVHRGMSKGAARERSSELLRSMGILDPDRVLRAYPAQLSGGMLQRVMIAGALSCEPDMIIADEATTALDVTVQSDILAILDELRRVRGTSVLLITHDLGLASVICDRIVVMYAGQAMLVQDPQSLFTTPAHPYGAALVAARPDPDRRVERLRAVDGRPVSALEAPSGCPFRPRCPYALPACAEVGVTLVPRESGTASACIRVDEIRAHLTDSVLPHE